VKVARPWPYRLDDAGTTGALPAPGRTAGTLKRRTPSCSPRRTQADTRSPARITVRRATSHADRKAAATDGHRNLAAACATTPTTPPKPCPLLGSTSP
jgi:hypothetical protein